jgi:hypothetical protein
VFVGVLPEHTPPRLRDQSIWTDDDDDADLGDATVEVRAFDTTHILVITSDPKVVESLKQFIDRAQSFNRTDLTSDS